MSARPQHVVVVGSDAPLWLTAAVLRAGLAPSGVRITAVELPARAGAADVCVSQPALEALHGQLRIKEDALLRATRGSFSLGQRFSGGELPPFFHAFGSAGAPIEGGNFLPYFLKAQRHGLGATLADFSLTAAAALNGRMLLPDEDTARFARTDYGYHLPAIAYAQSLRRIALAEGVEAQETGAVSCEVASGAVAALVLDGGRRIAADLVVDLTRDGRAIGALGVSLESWSPLFPADRILRARGPALRSVPCFADIRAAEWGWAGIFPSQDATQVVAAYASDLISEEEVLEATSALCGFSLAEARWRGSEPALRQASWAGNCVALGEAACRLDPVHDGGLHLLQLGLVHLLSLFPVSGEWAVEQAEYNRLMRALFERTRDFQAAHYQLARYPGAFWERGRAAAPPEALAHKLAIFAARGELALLEDETFPLDSWNALLIGHGLIPDSYAPSADRTSPEVMKDEFRRMLGFIKDTVLAQPSHDDYLAQHCGRRAA